MELLSSSNSFLNLRYAASLDSHSAMRSFETEDCEQESFLMSIRMLQNHTVKLAGIPSHLFHNVVSEAIYNPRLLPQENVDFSSFYLAQLRDNL